MGSGFSRLFGCEFGPLGVIKVPFIAACEDGDDAAKRVRFSESGEEVEGEENAGCNWKDVCDW